MTSLQQISRTALMVTFATSIGLSCPSILKAQLHDPMRPSRIVTGRLSIEAEKPGVALPPLSAILIGANSRTAIFGSRRVHEGERVGRYRVTRIHPGRVELSDGDSHLERRLFPAISTFKDER